MRVSPAIFVSVGLLLGLIGYGCRYTDLKTQIKENPKQRNNTQASQVEPNSKDFIFDSLPENLNNSRLRLPPGLKDFQDVFADVAEKAIPAVVSIYSERNIADPESGSPYDDFLGKGPFQYFFDDPHSRPSNPSKHKETGLGSGVIISSSGYILTNNHVVEGADIIKVQLSDDSEYPGTIIGTDKPSDMAVIKITLKSGKLQTLPLGNSDVLRIGEWVLAVGNPYGLSHTVTTGIISAKGRKNTGINSYENFLQTDAAINPGNSGGALLNLSGELIGINTAIFSRTGGYQGIGFAIPINMAKKITQDLIRDGEVTRGWLGISIQPIDAKMARDLKLPEQEDGKFFHGAMVGGVVPDSPAEKAGIKRGDIITKIGDKEIQDASDLLNQIALLIPEEWVEVRIIREAITLSFKTRIAKRDENRVTSYRGERDALPAMIGLQVAELTPEFKERFSIDKSATTGVVIIAVEKDSRASEAKIQLGDLVLEINRESIHNVNGFRTAMNHAVRGNKILMLLGRKQNKIFITL
jgi:serine protease Do